MKRKQSLSTYGHLYKRSYPVMNDERCQCCGEQAGLEWDHCPAITTAQLFVRNDKIRFIKVLLCKECNLILSDQLLPDFPSRFYTVKERLLERHKHDLISECRDNMVTTTESLRLADDKFNKLLHRIGFGLIKVDQLSGKHLAILNTETLSGTRIIDHLAAQPDCGLLSESNLTPEEDTQDNNSHPPVDYQTHADTSTPHFALNALDDFKVFLRNNRVYTKNGYLHLLNNDIKSLPALTLPEQPTQFFGCSWDELTANVCITTSTGLKYSLDLIEQYATSDLIAIKKSVGMYDMEELLDKLGITTREEYDQLWTALRVKRVDVVEILPNQPEAVYDDWLLW